MALASHWAIGSVRTSPPSGFRANPIAGAPSPLLFNTGDRGVWRADGTVIYLGRTDNQVKLRGVRLELGEILAALRGNASVKDAAAVIVGDADRQRLVAFVVGQEDQKALVPTVLRAYLQERLRRQQSRPNCSSLTRFPSCRAVRWTRWRSSARRCADPA